MILWLLFLKLFYCSMSEALCCQINVCMYVSLGAITLGAISKVHGGGKVREGARTSLARSPGFLTNTGRLFGNFRQMWPQHVNLCSIERYWKEFSKNFPLGVIYPQNLKIEGVKQVLYLDQPRPIAQGRTGEILFTPLCSPGARKLSGQKTFCVKLRRVRVPKFSHLYVFPIQRARTVLFCARPTALAGYTAESFGYCV